MGLIDQAGYDGQMQYLIQDESWPSGGEPSFETTQWSMVLRAGKADTRQQALCELCERYWMPLYAFLRRAGYDSHDAQDLTDADVLHDVARERRLDPGC